MKTLRSSSVLTLLAFSCFFILGAGRIGGNGEQYHTAMALEFAHAADYAKALYNQTLVPSNIDRKLAGSYFERIGQSLETARTLHAFVHKSYTSAQEKEISKDHEAFLNAHTNALEAFKDLKAVFAKESLDVEKVKTLSAKIFAETYKAVVIHKEILKKLSIPEAQTPVS
jgi:hypothetical protein